MPTQPKVLAVISAIASDMRVPTVASGISPPVCMMSRTNLSIAPSRPPGWNLLKSTAVKPRLSSSATASASPRAACISGAVVGAGSAPLRPRQYDVGRSAERAVADRGDGNEPDAEAARVIDQILELDRLSRPRQRHDDVIGRNHAEIAMTGFAGVHEEGRRARGGEGRRDFPPHMPGFAHAG